MSAFRLLLSLLLWTATAIAQQYAISTYAGGAPPATPVMGTIASVGRPLGIAVDAAGNVYFASDNCIFRLDEGGVLTRLAGNSRGGYSGDGGAAASAQLFLGNPNGLAVDNGGNLYIADSNNNRVRKVTPPGIISTVAGNGNSGYSGDGGPATSAQLWLPYGTALDGAGNLYIADKENSRVRKVTPTGAISTVAGNGNLGYSGDGGPATSAQLWLPDGVAVDSGGNLYIADYLNNRVRKVTPLGTISTIAGNGDPGYSGDGGLATSAQLGLPDAVAVDNARNLYTADTGDNRVRRVTPAGIVSTVAGNGIAGSAGDAGPATSAQFNAPEGIALAGP